VKTRWTFRCYPRARQRRFLGKTFGCVRFVYNRALQLRKDSYAENKTSVSYAQTSAALTGWKKEPGCLWLNEVSSVPLQQCLRHLQTAYRNFFEKRAAYPRFKSKSGEQGAEFTRSAFTWDGKTNTRDENAAKNILAEGHFATKRGGHVRPKATRVVQGYARRSVNQPVLP